MGDVGGGGKVEDLEVPGEEALVDDLDEVVGEPDGAAGGAVDVHGFTLESFGENWGIETLLILCPKGEGECLFMI